MIVSLPPGINQDHLSMSCIDINHFPTNYSEVRAANNEEQVMRIILGPDVTLNDRACIRAMMNNDAYIGQGKTRLEMVCHFQSWTAELVDELDRCTPEGIPFVFLRVTDPLSFTEGILVHNEDKGADWASSFTSHIDTFNLNILLSLTRLEIVDLRPPFNVLTFDPRILLNASQKLQAFFNSLQFSRVKRLILPLDLLMTLPQLMRVAGRSNQLETLELCTSASADTSHSHRDIDTIEGIIIRSISYAPHLQELIYPLEWATVGILRHLAFTSPLSCIRLKPLISDATGEESARLSQGLLSQTTNDWPAVCSLQTWFFPAYNAAS